MHSVVGSLLIVVPSAALLLFCAAVLLAFVFALCFAFASQTPTATLSGKMVDGPSAACWDPHHARVLASSDSVHLRTWDVRVGGAGSGSAAGAPTLSIEHAHEDQILDVDFNPNKPYHLLSTGRDRRIHVWDLRRCGPQSGSSGGSGGGGPSPLKTMLHHSHWAWQARFNRFHDQLVLSAGTELVNLWNMGSVSSAPVGELEHTTTYVIQKRSKTKQRANERATRASDDTRAACKAPSAYRRAETASHPSPLMISRR